MVLLGIPEPMANAILRIAGQLDLMGLALIFKLGAMHYDMVERSMILLGEEVMPRISAIFDRDAAAIPAAVACPSSELLRQRAG